MIVRLGVVVAASIAALTVKQLKVNNSKSGTCAYSPFFFIIFSQILINSLLNVQKDLILLHVDDCSVPINNADPLC